MSRTIEQTVYKFCELTEQAQDRAMQRYAERFGYERADEALKSLEKLAEHFGAKLTDWQIDYFDSRPSSADFRIPWDESETATLLAELGDYNPQTLQGLGDCKLTGYCTDEDAIDGFRQAWHRGVQRLEELLQAAFRSWLKACQADCADFYTVGTFTEHSDANEFEYFADGRLFVGMK